MYAVSGFDNRAYAQTLTDEQRQKLEAELAELETRIAEQRELLNNKQGERKTLERDISILEAQIEKAKLSIRARDLQINRLGGEIGSRSSTITKLSEKMDRQKEYLADLVRRTDEIDDISMVEIVLSQHTLTDFFEEFDEFQAVTVALHSSFEEIESTRERAAAEKMTLEEKRKQEMELKQLQELERKRVESAQGQKEEILTVTKGQEANYQQLIAQGEKSVAEIRAALFELRGAAAIPFGEAYDYALAAQKVTGVRAAVTLGVLKQETRMGEFLGTGNWQVDMHPTRDRPLFQVIAKTVGFDPNSVPVSAQPGYGWGGAMGPGQFIPSTWACYGGYINQVTGDCGNTARSLTWDAFWAGPWTYSAGADRIRNLLGGSVPSSPYRPRDAITATAVLMRDNGADKGGYANERLAALRYFAGWGNANNPSYAFYGDSVMEHAAGFQAQIDILER
jgi:peptidoglycan hydrolase CwlO-like protein